MQVAALLKVSDYCDATIAPLADKLAGRTIGFDGSIVNLVNHGHYHTRYDIFVASGDKGPESTVGPGTINRWALPADRRSRLSVGVTRLGSVV